MTNHIKKLVNFKLLEVHEVRMDTVWKICLLQTGVHLHALVYNITLVLTVGVTWFECLIYGTSVSK